MSNLTVSYTSSSAAPTGAATVPADASTADSPLGFFAALIDQLIADVTTSADKPEDQPADAAVPLGSPENQPLPPGYVPQPTPPAAAPQTGANLLASLTAQLDTLQSQGQPPSPDQLRQLDATLASLTAALALTTTTTAPQPAQPTDEQTTQLLASLGLTAKAPAAQPVADARQHLLALSQSFAATTPALSQKLQTLATQLADLEASPDRLAHFTGTAPGDGVPTVSDILRALLGATTPAADDSSRDSDSGDDLLQVLASLGISTASPAPTPATDTPADAATVPPALLRLSNQLSKLSTELAASAPELSAKLEAVATKIVAADADPKLLADLTTAASDPDGATLDKLVRSLLEPKSAPTTPLPAAPQIAASAELDIPAPLLPEPSKSAVAEVKAAPPQPTSVTADSATDPTPRLTVTHVTERTPEPDAPAGKPEPKAAAIIAEASKAADPAQTGTQQVPTTTAPIAATTTARALPAAYQPVANPINMGQVAFEMVRQIHQGTSRFTIRLDPPELGRVDVKMHVDPQGAVTARLTVDRAETLDMFQRDQRQLERALAQAGLDSARTNLEFSLRQNNSGQQFADQRQQQFAGSPRFSLGGDEPASPLPAITLYRGTASAGGVNIFA